MEKINQEAEGSIEIEFDFDHFDKQEEVFNSVVEDDYKYYIFNISRCGGKTIVLIDIVMYYLFNDVEDILFVSKTIPQAKKVFEQMKKLLEDSGLNGFITETNKTDRILKLANGSQIIFKSGEIADNLRGQNEHTIVICDEFAFFHIDTWDTALRQICGVQKVKKVIISSTPNGYHNAFYTMAKTAMEGDTRYKYFSYDYRANPYGQVLEDVMQAKRDMPNWKFSQEYECAFVGDGFSAFSDIEEVCCNNRGQFTVDNRKRYCAGLDIGLSNDYTVVSVMNDLGEQVDLLRFNNVSTEVWVDKVANFLAKWKVLYVVAEENYEKTLLNLLRKKMADLKSSIRIEYHRTSSTNKVKDVEALIVAFDYREVSLLNDSVLKGEFERFTKVDLSTSYTYRADNGNDDIVMAVVFNLIALNRIKKGNSLKVL